MFNFKRSAKAIISESETESNYSDVITEIHKEFNSAGDELYESAVKLINANKVLNEDKVIRLKKLGFTSSKEVSEAEIILEQRKISEENVRLITYYRSRYPFNRFIGQEQVIAICSKYRLVYGEISKYTGFIPDKKLNDIERFSVNNEDIPMKVGSINTYGMNKGEIEWDGGEAAVKWSSIRARIEEPKGMIMCAPLKDMKLDQREFVRNYQILQAPKDPIVLQPVHGGFLIVAAWGDEASDPDVTNAINN